MALAENMETCSLCRANRTDNLLTHSKKHREMRYLIILLAAAFIGCRAGAPEGHEHNDHNHAPEEVQGHEDHIHAIEDEHGHESHDHEAHDHSNHEGHEHDSNSHEGHDHIVFTQSQAKAAGLEIETVEPAEFRQVIKTGGRILNAPGGEVTIAATSNGIVSFTRILTEGAVVTKGQTIAVISTRGLVDGDPAARARAESEAAERDYRRAESLAADQIISQKELDEARRRYETARSTSPSGTVTSPVTGYIRNILVGEGEYVAMGQPIATTSRNNKLQLRAEVSERYFGDLPTITGANFKLPYDDTVYHTDRLLSYGKVAEEFYLPVILEFEKIASAVPGAYVDVWLSGSPQQNILSIPKNALTEKQGLYFVYLQHGDENYAEQEVAIGADDGKRVVITKGLKSGDIVVTRGVTQVRLAATSAVIPHGHTH